jgi:hypothetical protein
MGASGPKKHIRAGQRLCEGLVRRHWRPREKGSGAAVVDVPDLDQQLAQARADLVRAQADEQLAQVTYDRWKVLAKRNIVSQQAKDERYGAFGAMTRSKKTAAHYRARMKGLALVMWAASLGTAGAQALYPSPGGRRNDSTILNPQTAPSRWDRARFHRSGTRGRQGLGASPLRPEGPGNVTR